MHYEVYYKLDDKLFRTTCKGHTTGVVANWFHKMMQNVRTKEGWETRFIPEQYQIIAMRHGSADGKAYIWVDDFAAMKTPTYGKQEPKRDPFSTPIPLKAPPLRISELAASMI